jgi:trimeric autotransporter adhesin
VTLTKSPTKNYCMKKSVVLSLAAVLAVSGVKSFAAPVLSDNFNSYTNGNLVGQDGWAQTGASATTPIQVNSGVVTIGSSGQDVYSPFSSPVTLADGQSLYFGLTLNVSAAQATGDYFLHFTPNAGNSSLFYDRAFVQSTSGGYLLGLLGTSGAGTVTYGTQVLSFGTSYNFVLAYNYFSATTNSAIDSIYINPTDPAVANNTAYLTAAWQGSADTNQIAAVNFRQGTASSAPTLTVDNLVVSQTFGDTVPAPEPSTIALAAMGGAACLVAFRRKR